jgi:hypothetical protein
MTKAQILKVDNYYDDEDEDSDSERSIMRDLENGNGERHGY